ncbi:hypothetical protein [Fischerella sp. JS2]|uniref:hypothetical protein n=1 Tax=Fischerella sp. JS2 TaxID=2597771 RepID=UPI0028EB189F|nr:hypothetical protein [Fischerella sp. JS2]
MRSPKLTPPISPDFITVLEQAVCAYRGEASDRPPAAALVNALLEAEKAAKQQKLTYPFTSLLGQWRLCFTTGTRKRKNRGGIELGRGFYVPKLGAAHICFAATDIAVGKGKISNQVQLGGLLLKFTGPARYLGKKNLLAFDFTQMQISLFGRIVYKQQIRGGKSQTEDFYNQAIAKQPFFAFFLMTEDLIAARGRGGGLAIWIKESSL